MSRRPAKPKKITSVGEFIVGEPFGEGNYGIIRLGRRKDGEQVVIKELDVADGSVLDDVRREGNIMSLLDHELVISLYEQRLIGDRVFLVMEYAKGGDLLDLIMGSPNGRLAVEEAMRVFAQLVLACEYMHDRGVIHRDLKPDNIFLDERHNVRVGDFGLSVLYNRDHPSLTARAGTLHYASPETFLGSKIYGTELDVWSIGVVLYVMLHGRYPFWGKNDTESAKAILSSNPKYPRHFPPECVQLLQQIFIKAPFQRISISQIKKHPWIRTEILRQSRQLSLENVRQVKRVLSFQGTSRASSSGSCTTAAAHESDEEDSDEEDSDGTSSPSPLYTSDYSSSPSPHPTSDADEAFDANVPRFAPPSPHATSRGRQRSSTVGGACGASHSKPPSDAKHSSTSKLTVPVVAMRPPTKKSAVQETPSSSTAGASKLVAMRPPTKKSSIPRISMEETSKKERGSARKKAERGGSSTAQHASGARSAEEASGSGGSGEETEKRKHEKVRLKQWAMERVRDRRKNRKGRSASMSATMVPPSVLSTKAVTFSDAPFSSTHDAHCTSSAPSTPTAAGATSSLTARGESPPSTFAASPQPRGRTISPPPPNHRNRRLSLLKLHKFKACSDLHAAVDDQ
eukprot:TRINITY_DN4878_c0_g1_i1.p1 TRINITY_DN4878_c0_g1~~TRINITY_DN4878_c0_g1_i1.p1  ORF type:complete len:628 (+),score=185.30 TRINITY_DN4878_c0_g1_i1:187-2070(+)